MALRASTDAYGTGILADAGVLCEPIGLGRASDASDSSDLSDLSDKIVRTTGRHPGRGAFFVARVSEGRSPDDPG